MPTRNPLKAVAVIAGILLLIRTVIGHADIDPRAVNILKRWIAAEYQRQHQTRSKLADGDQPPVMQESIDVRFREVRARGTANRMIFKVEIEPGKWDVEGSPRTRYFEMRYSTVTGWSSVPISSSELRYFLAWFYL